MLAVFFVSCSRKQPSPTQPPSPPASSATPRDINPSPEEAKQTVVNDVLGFLNEALKEHSYSYKSFSSINPAQYSLIHAQYKYGFSYQQNTLVIDYEAHVSDVSGKHRLEFALDQLSPNITIEKGTKMIGGNELLNPENTSTIVLHPKGAALMVKADGVPREWDTYEIKCNPEVAPRAQKALSDLLQAHGVAPLKY